MTRILGAPRSRRRQYRLVGALASCMLLSQIIVPNAGAVHDTGAFELDGNASNDGTPGDDWDNVCHQVLTTDCSTTSNTTGATAVDWTSDNLLNGTPSLAASIFTGGGSKDPIDIDQWAWKDGAGGLPDKDNLLHSFAARYSKAPSATCPAGTATTCELLFFGSDRYDNSGDAQQGFWFFQNKIELDTRSVGGGQGFKGVHRNGDLLVISNFSNGGTTSTISVYKWNSAVNGNLELLATSTNAKCSTAAPADAFCGIVNPGTITMPWSFTDKSGTPTNQALNGEFYEGGVNLSLLGLAGECFASVASETRSSTSTTAVLKDFVLGSFGKCDSSLVTTPKTGAGADIPSGGLSIGTGSVMAKDSAVLTVSGIPTWSGTLKFYLCKVATSTDTCTTGGTQIGTTLTVTQATSSPILSDAATITAAANGTTGAPGRYCWRSEFTSGTSGVPNASDASATECFVVNPVTPTLTTNATATVEIGNPISDTATLTGTANKPGSPVINPTTAGASAGGSITFKAYGPDDATCTGTPAFTSSAITVSGNGSSYGSGSFTPTSAGTYRWVASYTGDNPNTLGATTACNDANETTVVNPKQPAIITNATAGPVPVGTALDDTATLSGTANKPNGSAAGGTITFSLYGPSDTPVCTTAIATRVVNVTGDGNYTASSGTGTGSLTPTAAGTYYWIAVYSGDSPNTLGVSGACGDANEASIVIQLQPTIVTAQTFTVSDSATITVGAGAGNLAGNVRFRLYDNATCSGTALYDSGALGVSGASPQTVSSGSTTITTSQLTLSWLVEYTSTNSGHKNVTSACNVEHASLSITNG